jgi:Tol biopolymer transport system component
VSFVGAIPGECPDVFTMDLDGSNVVRLTPVGCEPKVWSFDWMPGGAGLVFSGETCNADFDCANRIYSQALPAGTPVGLTHWNADKSDGSPSVSPDGTKIVFERDVFGFPFSTYIWAMNADGTGKTQLTSSRADYAPSWWP